MKNLIIFLTGIFLFALWSCDKDDPVAEIETITSPNEDSFESDGKAVTINGKKYYSAYGYSPGQDKAYRVAITDDNMYESNNIDNSLSVDLKIIRNNKELSSFTRKGRSLSFNVSISLPADSTKMDTTETGLVKKVDSLTFDISRNKSIEKNFTVDENHVIVIARIKSKRYRHQVDGTPTLTPAAQSLIDEGKFDDFIADYGSMYISSHTLGGELYYIYSYKLDSTFTNYKRGFEKKAKIQIANKFGLGSDSISTLSQDDKDIISQAEFKTGIVSTILGYAPKIIQNIDDLNGEIVKIQEYLNTNPSLASTIDVELRPYADFMDESVIKNAFVTEMKCYNDLEKWAKINENILYIKNSTKIPELKEMANKALLDIDQQMQNSSSCFGSSTPSDSQYAEINRIWKDEKNKTP